MRLYPRLSDVLAKARLEDLRRSAPEHLSAMVLFEHDAAAPVPTGGMPVSEQELRALRQVVLDSLEPYMAKPFLSRRDVSAFDRTLGRALGAKLDIVPSDAAHREVWSFLTVLVFPDLLQRRFSDMPDERALGGPRNALRRTWEREQVIGDLLSSSDAPLVEDELVGLFERTALARNRELVRALTRRVLSFQGTWRTVFARELYKQARYLTGPLLLDALNVDEIQRVVDSIEVTSEG